MATRIPRAKEAKIAELVDKGIPHRQVAKKVGVSYATVHNVLKRFRSDISQVKEFEKNKADIFRAIQDKGSQVVAEVLSSWDKQEIDALTAPQKNDLLRSAALATCQFYDKTRLETGQSTANVASLLLDVRKDLGKVPVGSTTDKD